MIISLSRDCTFCSSGRGSTVQVEDKHRAFIVQTGVSGVRRNEAAAGTSPVS